jgi:hypothetical protein
MERLIEQCRMRVKDNESAKLLFYDKTWYFLEGIDENDITFLKKEGYISMFTEMFSILWWVPSDKMLEGSITKRKSPTYPALFESFWNSYHKERRIGKGKAFTEWKALSTKDQSILPKAAEKYTAHIQANSLPKYMKHPERFIKSGEFKDYLEMDNNAEEILKVRNFFSNEYMKKTSHGYPFTEKEIDTLCADLGAHGLNRVCSLIWIYMNDYEPKIKQEAKDHLYNYFTFSKLLKGPLGWTKKTVPARCEYCGQRIGHSNKCPKLHAQKEIKSREKKEIEEARDMSVDLTKMFKDKIGRG